MTKLDLLKEKLKYWDIRLVHYDSFYNEEIKDHDSNNLVQEVINELIQNTKTKDDIFYKELTNEIERLYQENLKLKNKLNSIKSLLE
jgi:hypothetical protein